MRFTENDGFEEILSEIERYGVFCRLSKSGTTKLMLLAEEMLGLTVRLFDDLEFDFYVTDDSKKFTLVLSAKTIVNMEQKEKMLSISSDGKNAAAKGVLGKLRDVFQDMLISPYCGYATETMSFFEGEHFSLSAYAGSLSPEVKGDRWDGLEKSIIANIASDVTIGINDNRVEMTATICLT